MNTKIKESFLYSLDPRTKMLLLLVLIILGCAIMDPIVTMVMMALVYVLYRTSGYTAKQVWGITKPLLLAFLMVLYIEFPLCQAAGGRAGVRLLLPRK